MDLPSYIWWKPERLEPDRAAARQEETWNRRLKAFPAEKRVLSLLRRRHPDLRAGLPEATLNRADSEALIGMLRSKEATAREIQARIKFLALGLERGKNELGWDVSIPEVPSLIWREASPFTPASVEGAVYLGRIERAFLRDLERYPPQAPWLVAQILLSAILFGGLLAKDWLLPWAAALFDGFRSDHETTWLDMRKCRDDNGGRELRRWFPDPLTELLMLRLRDSDQRSGAGGRWSQQRKISAIWNPLEGYLRVLVQSMSGKAAPPVEALPKDMGTLLGWATTRLAYRIPMFLVKYAIGESRCASLPAESWARIRTGRAIPFGNDAQERLDLSVPVLANYKSGSPPRAAEQRRLLLDLYHAVRPPGLKFKRISADSRRAVRRLLDRDGDRFAPIVLALGRWTENLLSSPGKSDPLRVGTVYRYITALGEPLRTTFGQEDPADLEAQDILSRYQSILTWHRPRRRYRNEQTPLQLLARFHRFMMADVGVAPLDFSSLEADIRIADLGPEPNCLSPAMYKLVLDSLSFENADSRARRLADIRIQITMLGFRLGLRRGEALRLRLRDVIDEEEVLIRATRVATLKTDASMRRLPLILMPSAERARFIQWVNLRKGEEGARCQSERDVICSDALLFCDVDKPFWALPQNEVFGPIHVALRQVTRDSTFRFHLLRHSFANLLLLRLLGQESAAAKASFDGFTDQSFSEKDCVELRRVLLGERAGDHEPSGVSALWAVAQACGHISPRTTLGDYVHLCDWMLGQAVRTECVRLPLSQRAVQRLTSRGRSAVFNARSQGGGGEWRPEIFLPAWRTKLRKKLREPLDRTGNMPKVAIRQKPTTTLSSEPDVALVGVVLEAYAGGKRTIDNIARIYPYARVDEIKGWITRAEKIREMTTAAKKRRHYEPGRNGKTLFARLNLPADRELATQIFRRARNLSSAERQLLVSGIKTFLGGYALAKRCVRLDNSKKAEKYAQFLALLPIGKDCISIDLYQPLGVSKAEMARRQKFWTKLFGVDASQCRVQLTGKGSATGARRGRYVKKNPNGSAGVKICMPRPAGRRESYGFRYALYILAVATIDL